ncbi:MAG TPA: DUF3857 and transglutaminase domain-containing protein [Gemmatimonadaceae bacterium]|nr:DUF3857 and transglutaminase domain-containing protein [Gemmatimonadaceae bacterium]
MRRFAALGSAFTAAAITVAGTAVSPAAATAQTTTASPPPQHAPAATTTGAPAATAAATAPLPVQHSSLTRAPVVTPKGDPSVRDDTIYKLAVSPAAYAQESSVLLLDDGIVRYEADGRGTRTYRQVVQILTEDAVESYQEHSFSYAPGHQKLTVNWIRVVKPDGSIVSAAPSQMQDADVPATMGDPVYSDRKVRRVSLTGVAPGTIVDYSYTTEEMKPFLAGDFSESWSVTTGIPVMRSRYVVDVPASLAARVKERNLSFARAESTTGGRHVYVWATGNVAKVRGEPFAADSNGVYQSVAVSSPTTWQGIASWYAGLARDRYTVTPAVAAKIKELLAGARTRDDSIRAVHRWVAQDIRYVSIALGLGGYQPRAPQTVLETGFGDCKDKATLFVAALRSIGITAYPVLLSSSGGVDRAMPSIDQFDHAIAAVAKLPNEGGGYQFTDLTTEVTPYGMLPFQEQGEFALVVHPDGSADEETMPRDPITANRSETRVVGTVSEKGLFDGTYEETAGGAMQYGLRNMLSTPLDSAKRATLLRAVASHWFEGGDGDSLVVFDGKDLRATPRIAMRIRHGRATSPSGDTEILTNPLGSLSSFSRMADQIEERGTRRFPIDAMKVAGASVGITEIRMTLPAGWHARLPKSVSATGPFGSFSSEYAQEGRVLRITRRTTGVRGVLPPERVSELLAYLRTVGSDDTRFIVIDKR